jgi:hypothetical protein
MQVSAKKNIEVFILLMFALFYSCSDYNKKSHKDISEASINAGELLAKKYCQSCHLFPAPSLLNTESWVKGVLPNMGPRLGIFNFKWESYPSLRYDKNVPKNFYPSQPLLTDNEWQDIINYYTASSPDSLPLQQRAMSIEIRKDLFAVSMPPFFKPAPNTCYIKVDTTTIPHTILQSDVFTKEIIRYDTGLKIIDSIKAASAMVDIDFKNKTMVACNIGVLNPNNGSFGKLQYVIKDAAGKMHIDTTFHINNLQRPVQLIKTDLNKDGLDDYLVCEFGYVTGSLNWYENNGKNNFTKHILRAVPGAIKAYVKDYNNDGLPDIFVLFAQGDEGIFLFTNKGNGQFDQKTLLRFPPSYGSSYFELDDFNKDGFPDILYTCGDNADFSPVLKPYHGVYIFMNDGKYNFTQKYFFPVNGCYKAMAADFNNDGNLDIAAISFFADYTKQPEEGFVYLENIGGLNFKPYSVPEAMNGHWLTMDVGDIYGNGKKSILLGNFSRAPSNLKRKVDWKDSPPFLILNKTSSLIK